MKRACDCCGAGYEAKRSTSKYCSSLCRTRASRLRASGAVVDLPKGKAKTKRGSRPRPADRDDQDGEREPGAVETATLAALEQVGRAGTPLGATALTLARRLDGGHETGSGMASLAKQLQHTLDAATANTETEKSPVDRARDELAARRERRGA